MKYYAVKNGRKPGIYTTWDDCKKQVDGYAKAEFKSFKTLEDAKEFVGMRKQIETSPEEKPVIISKDVFETEKTIVMDIPIERRTDTLIAYVDGSYNIKTHEYGYGCVIIHGQSILEQFNGKGDSEDYVTMRNVAGEIIGSEMAIRYAIKKGYKFICIYYDYEGIEKWANSKWKANKPGTIAYQRFIQESRQHIEISFIKVLAHSGDIYNDVADKLAKKAVGIA